MKFIDLYSVTDKSGNHSSFMRKSFTIYKLFYLPKINIDLRLVLITVARKESTGSERINDLLDDDLKKVLKILPNKIK